MEKRRNNEKNNSFNRDLKALMRVYDVRLEDIADEIGIDAATAFDWLKNEHTDTQHKEICRAIRYLRDNPCYERPHELERSLMRFFDVTDMEMAHAIGTSKDTVRRWLRHSRLSAEKEKILDNGLLKIILCRLDAEILKPKNSELKEKMREAILCQRNGSNYKDRALERSLMQYFNVSHNELAQAAGFTKGGVAYWLTHSHLNSETFFENALLDIILRRLDTRR